MTDNERLANDLVSLEEMIRGLEDQLACMEAERGSEIGLFGDAWPGADQNIAGMREAVQEAHKEAAWLRGAFGL
jgi:hypothetical protein